MNTVVDIQRNNPLLNPVLITGCIIILVSFAIRSSFGLFQIPISEEFGWYRADFSFAIAIQNLFWGIGQPIFSAIAEKFGDRKAIVGGGISYALGLALSSYAITPGQHQLLEILVGFGIAGTGFGVILAVVGRASSDKNRSMALGIATAAGSVGQIIGPMLAQVLLQDFPWQSIFLVFACFILLSLFVLFYMRVPPPTKHQPYDANLSDVIFKAIKDPSFILIFFGFFSCGYQLAFITAHFPAFITEMCSAVTPGSVIRTLGVTATSTLGAISISLIGLANIGGTILAGWLGNIYSRKLLLGWIYVLRTIVSWLFIVNPITPESVVLFSILMGSLWLATVPLTAGLVGKIYGLRYMGTLFGLIFFSHQLGGFLGVWLGGLMYDLYGNYMLVWWVGVGMGAFSAIVHFLVDERPWLERQVKVMA